MLQQKKKKKTEQLVFTANNAKITNIEKKKKEAKRWEYFLFSINKVVSIFLPKKKKTEKEENWTTSKQCKANREKNRKRLEVRERTWRGRRWSGKERKRWDGGDVEAVCFDWVFEYFIFFSYYVGEWIAITLLFGRNSYSSF